MLSKRNKMLSKRNKMLSKRNKMLLNALIRENKSFIPGQLKYKKCTL